MKYSNLINRLIVGSLLLALTGGVGTQAAALASPLARNGTSADGTGPVSNSSALDPKQAIDDFVANADQPVGADEVVSFLTAGATIATQADAFGPAAVFNPAETNMHIAAARLTDTKFVVAYRDVGNSYYGTAIVGQVFGKTIAWGSETVFNPAVTQYESVAALSDTKFVVAYQDGGNSWHGTAIVGQVSGTAISYGPEYVFNPADTEYASVAALSETKFVVVYRDAGDANHGKAVVGQVFGNTINCGSETVFNPVDTAYQSVARLSDTDFVVAYTDLGNSYYGTAIVGQVSGYGITYGSEAVFNPATTYDGSVAALSSSKFVVAYQDGGGSNCGTAVVGQVTGTSIVYGSETVFSSAITKLFHSGGVAGLSDSTFVVGYENQGDSDGRVVVGTVSGSAIIFGNQVSYNAGSSSFDVTVVALSASKYVVAWDDESNGDYGTAKVGTVPIPGPAAVFNPAGTGDIAAAKLTDSTFVVAYRDGGNSDHGTARVGQVSGTTITWGDETVFHSADTYYASVAALTDSSFVVAYQDADNFYYGTAIVGQIAGTSISYGSENVFNTAWTEYISVAALSETKFVVVYEDVGNANYGTARVGQVSDKTITYGSETVFNPAQPVFASVAALTGSSFVVAYQDAGNSYYGTAIVGQVSGTSINIWDNESVFNAAATYYESVAALTNSSFVVAYVDGGNSDYGTAIVGRVSGTSINWGDESVFNVAAGTYLWLSGGATRLSATAFVVGFEDASYAGQAVVGTVSGNTISFGHQVSVNAGSTSTEVTAVGLSPSEFVVVWCDTSNSDYGTAKVGTVPTGGRAYLPLVLNSH